MNTKTLKGVLSDHKKWLNDRGGNRADLRDADLHDADLHDADLRGANLRDADLNGADLNGAYLRFADLNGADLSGAKGLTDARAYLKKHFDTDDEGVICYKVFGLYNDPPAHWSIAPGEVITEVCNPTRTLDCACGVNVGTREWVEKNKDPGMDIWKCRIGWMDLVATVVPYNTDGKIRCERVTLLEKL